jgi:hypothetical protein
MGYDVHIMRNSEVSLNEWLTYLRSDPEMRLDGFAEARLPDGVILRTESEGLAVWTAYFGQRPVWFDYYRGTIVVKNPDEEMVRKMYQIARTLSARVEGEEGELYGESGEPIPEPRRRWWQFWKRPSAGLR